MEKDTLSDDREEFKACSEAEAEQRKASQHDLEFALLEKQWDEKDIAQRDQDGRPHLITNYLPSFLKQVTNDARLSRPAINVAPLGGGATKQTADILSDVVRNIETLSQAQSVYDCAFEFATAAGFGYYRINVDYARDDEWDQDITMSRISNPFSVYGDYEGKEATSTDWNRAFVTDWYSKTAFERRWGKEYKAASFEDGSSDEFDADWFKDKRIRVAERWVREEVPAELVKLSDGTVLLGSEYLRLRQMFDEQGSTVVGTRETRTHKVKQRLITGCDILEENDWLGKYIPIIPMYGEEVNINGKRHFISLVRRAKDAQRMVNYWKPLALDTKLPTPTGWTTMGEVQTGDHLYDEMGKPCRVLGKSPVHIHRDCFRVTFGDGSSIVADSCHPWQVEERGKRTSKGETWTTKQVTTAELRPRIHYIDVAKPLECSPADLPIDPYLLGFWLGDGNTNGPAITPGDGDMAEVISIIEGLGYKLGKIVNSGGSRHGTVRILGVTDAFRKLGVIGNKHIPPAYLRASEDQRWALLQGLMDSDGSIAVANRQCMFVNTNMRLADGFAELLRSLGIKATSLRREARRTGVVNAGSIVQESVQFSFSCYADEPVFRLQRKAAVQGGASKEHRRRTKRHGIVSITPVPSVPVQCVAVDSPNHLFLAGESMVPTHNTVSTELVALQPKAPYIGAVGAFNTDAAKWGTANRVNWDHIEYDPVPGEPPPMRQPFSGVPAGALQMEMGAHEDMKTIMGLHDASLGARSNETSGKAIMARQREGDVSTYNFVDNRNRAVEHGGRIIVDLIPKVYSAERIMRCIQEDGSTYTVPVNQPVVDRNEFQQIAQPQQGPMPQGQPGPQQNAGGPPEYMPLPGEEQMMQMTPEQIQELKAITKIFDITTGKYGVVVKAGPSFTSRREEASQEMMEFIRVFPQSAPFIGDLLAKNLDWPGSEQVAERLRAMLPPQAQSQINPMVQQLQQAMQQQGQEAQQFIGQLQQQIADLTRQTQDKAAEQHRAMFDAHTKRMQEVAAAAEKNLAVVPNPTNPQAAMVGDYVAMPIQPQTGLPQEPDPVEMRKVALEDRKLTVEERRVAMDEARTSAAVNTENVNAESQRFAQIDLPTVQLQQHQEITAAIAAALGQVAQSIQQKPTRKVAKAVKQPDGSYLMESVEEPVTAVPPDATIQ